MITIPLQFFGIGDVIFTQTLVSEMSAGTNKILWPVESQFVEGLNRAYPYITFVDKRLVNIDHNKKDDYIINGARVLPLRWADTNLNLPFSACMKAKYMYYQKDWTQWREKAPWMRCTSNELALFDLLGLKPGDEYTLINRTYGSDSKLKVDIPVEGIEMRTIESFSLFDWATVLEHATEIHTVSTSIIYILEMLPRLKAKEIHLYARKPHEIDFRNIDYILSVHKYVFHY